MHAGHGTISTVNGGTTCELAPLGFYSPGGPINSTTVQACPLIGTTTNAAGSTADAACDVCIPGEKLNALSSCVPFMHVACA